MSDIDYKLSPSPSFCGVAPSEITPGKVPALFGEPDEIETADDSSSEEDLHIYHFLSKEFSLFFQQEKLITISVANPEFLMFNTPVFNLREKEIIELFAANGFPDHEIDKNWGEKQLAFDTAGISMFFDNQKLSEVFIDIL